MFYIVASDLDGTLLNAHHQLTSFTKEILRLLITIKVHFVFATGRHYANVIRIRDSLNINAYMITSNGARIYNTDNKLVAAYNLDSEIASYLLNVAHYDPKIITNVFRYDEWLINRYHFDQKNLLQVYNINYKFYQQNSLLLDGISKIHFTSNSYQNLFYLEEKLNFRWGNRINVSFSLPTCLEVISGEVSKGHALKIVANLLGYELKDCISFGDGMNDQEMLSMSGKGCIMYNAQQRLKDALPLLEIIGSNLDDAVPFYLKSMYFC